MRKDIRKLEDMLVNIAMKLHFPAYLGIGMAITFAGYLASAFMCMSWLVAMGTEIIELSLPPTFSGVTVVFLIVGLMAFRDVHAIMKKEFEEGKKQARGKLE